MVRRARATQSETRTHDRRRSRLRAAIPGAAGALAAGVIGLAALTGCTIDNGHPGHGYSSGGAAPGGGPPPASPAQPLLVDVDANQTLETTPGSGLGVYVEYVTGGHWVVWWTCDTDRTGYDCHYQIDATVADGALTNVAGQNLDASDSLTQPSAQQVSAITTTSHGADGVQFDAPAGAALTVSVQVDADVYFFFVQDKLVNGGYSGALTNPLMFQPSTP